jgi:hypothetical protein
MTFYSDNQRKAVMSMLSRLNKEVVSIRDKNTAPLMVKVGSGDSVEDMELEHNRMKYKMQDEVDKIKREAEENRFSDKDRGSVPLLETTYVIRGGQPKERQTAKRLLDVVGNEPALKDINTIRISDELNIPFEFNLDAKAVTVRNSELHVKGSDIPVDLAIAMLAQAMVMRTPGMSEDSAFDRAKEVVSIYLLEREHREKRLREVESAEVYQVGAEKQPQYEVSEYAGPPLSAPLEAKVTIEEKATPVVEGGLPSADMMKKQFEEQEKSSMYYVGGADENK